MDYLENEYKKAAVCAAYILSAYFRIENSPRICKLLCAYTHPTINNNNQSHNAAHIGARI